PRSIIVGLVAGWGGGFLSSTVAALAFGKRRLNQLLLRRFWSRRVEANKAPRCESWVATVKISRRRSPATVSFV
ncbi:unnamed protein product, partial [Brassica oleracea]